MRSARATLCLLALLISMTVAIGGAYWLSPASIAQPPSYPSWIEDAVIPVDGISRRGKALDKVKDIVVHYVGNPNTTARANRNWYESPLSSVSSHFIVGLEGEVLLCVPLNEVSSASNWRNHDTISIEVCHPDDSGVFNQKTYDALVKLTAWLLRQNGLDTTHIIRHHDVTGKECPRWFVRDPAAWEQFKADVKNFENPLDNCEAQ